MWLLLKVRNIINLIKTCLFENQAACVFPTVWKYITPEVSVTKFNTLTQCLSGLGKRENCAKPLTRKQGCPKQGCPKQGLRLGMESLQKMFPTVLDMKNSN